MNNKRPAYYTVHTFDRVVRARASHERKSDRWYVTDTGEGALLGWITPPRDDDSLWTVYYRRNRIGEAAERVAWDRTREGAVMALVREHADRRERMQHIMERS